MKAPLIHVASLVFNTPLAIIPEKLEVILHAIGPRLVMDEASLDELLRPQFRPILLDTPEKVRHFLAMNDVVFDAQAPGDNNGDNSKPYRLTNDGIAVIPVRGTLMKRFSFLGAASGCSSYASLGQAASAAQADPQVKGVLFDIDSPGGTTHGCFELSDMIYQMRGDKPMWAVANDLAASAAYAFASASDRIWVTRTAGVGSIGVFALHADQSSLDEQAGVKFTYIFAGKKKTDGNPHQSLSKSARADIQAEVDREYDMFVATVARNRGFAGADAEKIQDTEAAVFFAQSATPLLADEVGTFEEALEALTAKVNGRKTVASGKVAIPAESGDNAGESRGAVVPAIPSHHTATSDKAWDGPRAKKNLRQDESAAYYRSAYAFAKSDGDPKTKAGYTFIHHEVSSGGDVGAANIKGCQSSIGVLNGGRSGTVLKGADRRGTYNHVATHLRDAKLEPAPLAAYQQYIAGALEFALERGDDQLHATALSYLLEGDAEEPEGGEVMAKRADEDMRRAKKSEAEAEAEAAKEKDDDSDDKDNDSEDDDDETDRPEGKKAVVAANKAGGKMKKAGRAEAEHKDDDSEDDDDDEKDDRRSRRGSLAEVPVTANSAARKIVDLCVIAGAPELAAEYISRDYSVDKVIAKLSARRAKASAEGTVNSFVSGNVGGATSGGQASVDNCIEQARVMSANSGGKLTQSQCMEKLLRAHPDIYSGYLEERGAVAAQVAFTGGGRALNEYVLGNQRRYLANLGLSTAIDDVPGRRPM